jgi:TRAP-type C4-dicarboxylate transport system substrate-binding protein
VRAGVSVGVALAILLAAGGGSDGGGARAERKRLRGAAARLRLEKAKAKSTRASGGKPKGAVGSGSSRPAAAAAAASAGGGSATTGVGEPRGQNGNGNGNGGAGDEPASSAGGKASTGAGGDGGDHVVLRFGTIAPDGTSWSRLAKSVATALSDATHGQVTGKWYFNGIAGDEIEMAERIRRDQLDGIVSGGMLCQKLSPSMRVLRVIGLFQSRDESAYVAGRLKSQFDDEFRKAGYVNLGSVGVGPDLIFSRQPIRSMADLRKTRMWAWTLDEVFRTEWPLLGVRLVPTSINEGLKAYEDGQLDGFFAVPSSALAFQWSSEARYMTDLRVSFLRTCILVATRAYDALPLEAQSALTNAAARGILQLEELGRSQDEQLLHGLFEKQGIQPVPVSESFRSEFFAEALAARERMPAKLVRRELLQRVLALLADFRAEHHLLHSGRK